MISLETIEQARERISRHIRITPVVMSAALSELAGTQVSLKLEHRQLTGSFKLRGATNAVLQLTQSERDRGVVAASTGNHGRALSYAAGAIGSRATICMSHLVPENKVAEIRRLGARVRIVGSSQDEAQVEVDRLVAEEGLSMIPPFDHPWIIAGQGTVGLEIVEAMPDVAAVLVPLSGGGLAAGVAAAVKAVRPDAKVIGITMERGAAMKAIRYSSSMRGTRSRLRSIEVSPTRSAAASDWPMPGRIRCAKPFSTTWCLLASAR